MHLSRPEGLHGHVKHDVPKYDLVSYRNYLILLGTETLQGTQAFKRSRSVPLKVNLESAGQCCKKAIYGYPYCPQVNAIHANMTKAGQCCSISMKDLKDHECFHLEKQHLES